MDKIESYADKHRIIVAKKKMTDGEQTIEANSTANLGAGVDITKLVLKEGATLFTCGHNFRARFIVMHPGAKIVGGDKSRSIDAPPSPSAVGGGHLKVGPAMRINLHGKAEVSGIDMDQCAVLYLADGVLSTRGDIKLASYATICRFQQTSDEPSIGIKITRSFSPIEIQSITRVLNARADLESWIIDEIDSARELMTHKYIYGRYRAAARVSSESHTLDARLFELVVEYVLGMRAAAHAC